MTSKKQNQLSKLVNTMQPCKIGEFTGENAESSVQPLATLNQ
jgi:hypothetical protein